MFDVFCAKNVLSLLYLIGFVGGKPIQPYFLRFQGKNNPKPT